MLPRESSVTPDAASQDAPDRDQIERSLARALAFLEHRQLPTGEFRVLAWDPYLPGGCIVDPSVFPTALIAQALSSCPAADGLCDRAQRFLLGEMDRHELWRHWSRENPRHRELPPDLDDTSCAAAFLSKRGVALGSNRELMLANRDRDGLFFTWITPRLRWTPRRHRKVALAQLRHIPTLYMFFTRTAAAPYDVDAAVNANCLFYLGEFDGRDRIENHLVELLRAGRETSCDKWYDNPFIIWYFFSRALTGPAFAETAAAIIAERLAEARPANALEVALAICGRLNCGRPVPAGLLASLLAAQTPSGGWPLAAFYSGGRAKLGDGSFAQTRPDMTRWGSEELTTGLCVEALSRSLQVSAE